MTEEKKYDEYHGYSEHHENQQQNNVDAKSVKIPNNLNQMLVGALSFVVVLNILVMGYFTYSVNNKLEDAIDLTKPQEAKLTLVSADNCPLCGNLAEYNKVVKAQNVELKSEDVVSSNSAEGKVLIKEFGLTRIPALIFVTDDEIKSNISKALEKDSRKVNEKTIVWEKTWPPYLDIETNSISGLVDVVYITDKRCSSCYNPLQIHRPILQGYGLAVQSEKSVDILDVEGRDLVSKYKIEEVPTMILTGAGNYEALLNVWKQVGTIELDGVLVFRKNEVLNQTYKNLTIGKIVTPPLPSTQTQ